MKLSLLKDRSGKCRGRAHRLYGALVFAGRLKLVVSGPIAVAYGMLMHRACSLASSVACWLAGAYKGGGLHVTPLLKQMCICCRVPPALRCCTKRTLHEAHTRCERSQQATHTRRLCLEAAGNR